MHTVITKTIAAVAVLAGMTACTTQTYYQVYKVSSDAMKVEEQYMVYENNDIRVSYNLWGVDGPVGFSVMNKTDKDLFIDMGRTALIVNDYARDYYQEHDLVCVPAHAFRVFNQYKVEPDFVQTCKGETDFPKDSVKVGSYNEANSPLTINNRIAYSFDQNGTDMRLMDNKCYLSAVTNYSKKAAFGTIHVKDECYGVSTTHKRVYSKAAGPNKFYRVYQRTDNSGW